MANSTISDLTALTGANVADDDEFVIVDTSATETKRITLAELLAALVETDTWIPALSDGANADAIYTKQSGYYTKIGTRVQAQGRIRITSLGSISGAVSLTGLPYPAHNVTDGNASGVVGSGSALSIAAGETVSMTIAPNTSVIDLQLWDNIAGTTALGSAEFTSTGEIVFSVDYIAAS